MVFSELDDFRSLRRGKRNGAFRQVVRLPDLPPAPESVVHQYRGENFRTDEWIDTAPSGPQADMSITGVSASTLNGDRAASSDGVDDFGTADGPQTLPENETFGIAMVVQSSDNSSPTPKIIGTEDGSVFSLANDDFFDNSTGELLFNLVDDTGSDIRVETATSATKVFDADVHLVCINKTGNDPSNGDISFYVDDMSSETNQTVHRDNNFSHTSFSSTSKMGFFADNRSSNVESFIDLNNSFIEFKESPYSALERQALKRRVDAIPSVP
jgi:hypothetical protein